MRGASACILILLVSTAPAVAAWEVFPETTGPVNGVGAIASTPVGVAITTLYPINEATPAAIGVWDGTGWRADALPWIGDTARVLELEVVGDHVLAAGDRLLGFRPGDPDSVLGHVVRLDDDRWVPLGDLDAHPQDFAFFRGRLHAGGDFSRDRSRPEGEVLSGLARYDPDADAWVLPTSDFPTFQRWARPSPE